MNSHKSGFLPAAVIVYTLFTFSAIASAGTYSGGSGTADDPYKISTPADLTTLGNTQADYNKSFILINDIDLCGQIFQTAIIAPDIGRNDPLETDFQGKPFTGRFDGTNHSITRWTIDGGNNDYLGLFGMIGSNGTIMNLVLGNYILNASSGSFHIGGLCGVNSFGRIERCYAIGTTIGGDFVGGLCGSNSGIISQCHTIGQVSGGWTVGGLCSRNWNGMIVGCFTEGEIHGNRSVGGLCGTNEFGTITGCYVTCLVTGNSGCIGGLCGENSGGSITRCYTIGLAEGGSSVGGICGQNWDTISLCYSTMAVKGQNNYTGGLCGRNYTGIITLCYATGSVSGQYDVGGLCGENFSATIRQCYATGSVSGIVNYVGGLCGDNWGGKITSCFWDKDASGLTISSGGIGKSTADMKTEMTFSMVKWDFVGESANGTEDVWRMCGDGVDYPRLSWQFSRGGDLNCPNGVGLEDLMYQAERWMAGPPETIGAADANGDGRVGIEDFAVMAGDWMKGL